MRQSFSRDLVKPDGESSGIGNSDIGGNPLGNSDIGKLLFAGRDVASRGGQVTGGQLTGGQLTDGQLTDGQGRIPPSSALPFRTTLEALRADNGFTSAGAPLTARSGNNVPGGKCCCGGKCCRSGNGVPGGDDGNRIRLAAEHLARRLRLPVPLILPNLREIDGRLVCSGPFLVAILNACGRFSPLRFELLDGQDGQNGRDGRGTRGGARRQGDEAVRSRRRTSSAGDGRYPACRAVATDRRTGETLATPPVPLTGPLSGPLTGLMSGPEQGGDLPPEALPHYRAAALFGDLYAPELLMGIRCAETPDVPPLAGQTSPDAHGETTGTPKTTETTSGEAAKTTKTAGTTSGKAAKATKTAGKTAEKAEKSASKTAEKATKTSGKSSKTAETAAETASEASSTASAKAGTSSTASGVVAPCGVASLDDPVFPCPRKGGGLVSDDDCFYCTSRKRCDRNGRYGRK